MRHTAITFMVLLLLVSPMLVNATTTDYIASCPTSEFINPAFNYAFPVIASGSGSLNSVGVNVVTPVGNYITGIYSDVAGVPNALLAQSTISAESSGWNDASVTGVSIVSATQYWLAVIFDDSGEICDVASGLRYYSINGGVFQDPWDVQSTDSVDQFNMRMIYTPAATTTTTASTTTTVNPLSVNSLPEVFVYSLNIPFFGDIMLLLAFGISAVRSRNIVMAMLWTSLVSFALLFLTLIDSSTSATVTMIFIAVFLFSIFSGKHKGAAGGFSTLATIARNA